MQKLLLCLLLLFLQPCYGQISAYISVVDSFVSNVNNARKFYTADSVYHYVLKNASGTIPAKVVLTFSDSKGKNLLKAEELSINAADSTLVVYYFQKRQLIKMDACTNGKNHSVKQVFYLKNNRFLFPDSYNNSPFSTMNLVERSKLYLKFKARRYEQNK